MSIFPPPRRRVRVVGDATVDASVSAPSQEVVCAASSPPWPRWFLPAAMVFLVAPTARAVSTFSPHRGPSEPDGSLDNSSGSSVAEDQSSPSVPEDHPSHRTGANGDANGGNAKVGIFSSWWSFAGESENSANGGHARAEESTPASSSGADTSLLEQDPERATVAEPRVMPVVAERGAPGVGGSPPAAVLFSEVDHGAILSSRGEPAPPEKIGVVDLLRRGGLLPTEEVYSELLPCTMCDVPLELLTTDRPMRLGGAYVRALQYFRSHEVHEVGRGTLSR